MPIDVSVVMPALNEEGNIERAISNAVQAFEKLQLKGEIIVVNDGSRDHTQHKVRAMMERYPFIQLVEHKTALGIGRSFWDGAQKAKGEVVTLLPGDAENDGHEILRYLPLMSHVDLVVPFVFNRGKRTLFRRQLSALYRIIINKTFSTSLNYMNGTVMYRRAVLNTAILESNGFFYQTELLIKLLRAGYLYSEVPYGLYVRGGGASKAVTLKSLKRVIADFLHTYVSVVWKNQTTPLASDTVSARRRLQFQLPSSPEELPPFSAKKVS